MNKTKNSRSTSKRASAKAHNPLGQQVVPVERRLPTGGLDGNHKVAEWWEVGVALTPCVPLARLRERGIMECGRKLPHTLKLTLQHSKYSARGSLSYTVEEGLGVRATKNARTPHAANSSDVPLSGG